MYDSKRPGNINYKSYGLAGAKISFKNNWKAYFDENWQEEINYIRLNRQG